MGKVRRGENDEKLNGSKWDVEKRRDALIETEAADNDGSEGVGDSGSDVETQGR